MYLLVSKSGNREAVNHIDRACRVTGLETSVSAPNPRSTRCSPWVEKPLFFLLCLEVCISISPQELSMEEHGDCTSGVCPGASATGETVSIYVEHRHPLLQLKRAALGGAVRGHDAPLATSGQKHRWPPWLAVGCVLVRALDRVDGGEKTPRTRLGSVRGRKCRGAGVHWAPGRSPPADSGPLQHRSGLYGPGQRRRGGDQRVGAACGPGLGLCRCQYPVVGYHGAGVAHWVSQRTGYLAGFGTALWARPGEAPNAWGVGGRSSARPGTDHPQDRQRTPSV